MIGALKKIWQFAGKEVANINKSVVFCFMHAICSMFQIGAIYVIVQALINGETGMKPAFMAFVFMAVELVATTVAFGLYFTGTSVKNNTINNSTIPPKMIHPIKSPIFYPPFSSCILYYDFRQPHQTPLPQVVTPSP